MVVKKADDLTGDVFQRFYQEPAYQHAEKRLRQKRHDRKDNNVIEKNKKNARNNTQESYRQKLQEASVDR